MIKLSIQTDGQKVVDNFKFKDVTLKEVALVLYRLEEIKLRLLTEFEFKSEFEFEQEGE